MKYDPPNLSEFAQLRRALPVVAAVLLLVAPLLPMWHIRVRAVQYPDTILKLHLYAYPHIAGDYAEMAALNKYIGFYYPDPVFWQPNYDPHPKAIDVPEWSLGPLAFLCVAGAGLFVAVAPDTDRLKRGLTWQLVGSITVLTVMLADIQYRLYQAGHSLDESAPVMGVDGFTPPLWGKYQVANITSYSRLGIGAYVTALAIGLLVVAFYFRDSPATFGDLPDLLAGRIEGGREWLDERTVGDDEWVQDDEDPTARMEEDPREGPSEPDPREGTSEPEFESESGSESGSGSGSGSEPERPRREPSGGD